VAKKYTRQFKERAVRLASESGRPISETALELGVKYQTLYQWMQKAGKAGATAEDARPTTIEDELRRTQRELEEMRQERDFLKKAVAFFARSKE
jgi:transposase